MAPVCLTKGLAKAKKHVIFCLSRPFKIPKSMVISEQTMFFRVVVAGKNEGGLKKSKTPDFMDIYGHLWTFGRLKCP